MASLFIDSTYDVTLGILDDSMSWIEFERFQNQKASAIIQTETHNLLQKAKLKVRDIKSVITIAGPGFYTGLRLSEGFADVFIFNGTKHYSFLSYEIPRLNGIKSGVWMTKAYRGEYFFHLWDEMGERNELVATKELASFLQNVDKSSFYIHSDSAIDDFSRQFISNANTTYDILKSNPSVMFKEIVAHNSHADSFYFRAPEDEFKVSL